MITESKYSETCLNQTSLGPSCLNQTSLGPSCLNQTSLGPTCLNQTSLGPSFVFGIDRFSVYISLIIKDFPLWGFIYILVYTGFLFIHCSDQTGLYRILVYSLFGLDRFIQDSCLSLFGLDRFIQDSCLSLLGLDRFIQDSCLFTVWFRQVYTGFLFIHCSV